MKYFILVMMACQLAFLVSDFFSDDRIGADANALIGWTVVALYAWRLVK